MDAASRKDIRAKEKADRQADRDRGAVIIGVMDSKIGRNYIWEQLAAAHVFTTSYSTDALAMAFAEGERNSGLRLLDDIMSWCPEQFTLMMREQNDRRNLEPVAESGTDAESFPEPGADVYDS